MEKIKGVFSKIGSTVKSHLKVVIAVVAVVVVAILALNFIGGSEKRTIKKYMSALNSYKKDKILKVVDEESACAGISETEDSIENFDDRKDDVEDSHKDKLKDGVKEAAKSREDTKTKYSLKKIIYTTTAKDNKDIKKVVFKYKVTSKASDDEKDDAEDDDIWKKVKAFNTSSTGYGTAYLYKNKIISTSLYDGVSSQISSYSGYDYSSWDY